MKADNSMPFPESFQEAMVYFDDAKRGLDFMVSLRWPDGVVKCPHCGSERVSFLSTRSKWKCMAKDCHKQFSAKVGTIFEDSALGYDKWFPAMWMIVNAKNGISSYEIARALRVTQKTAWFMLHRIRLAMESGSFDKMDGRVEADEAFLGGKGFFMHKTRKARLKRKGMFGMVLILGLLQRKTADQTSQVRAKVVPNIRTAKLVRHVSENVEPGSKVYTDAFKSYRLLREKYDHAFVDHDLAFARGLIHTNGLENFWSLLKRAIKGTYVSIDPVHLHRHVSEEVFRFNERVGSDGSRFVKASRGILGRGLRYLNLIDGKGGEDLSLRTAAAR